MLNKGGVIKGVCKLRLPACIEEYADANNACADSTECLGECLVKQPFAEAGKPVTGVCSENNDACGCFQMIKSGVAQQVICVD
ncbi:MAG: hypothetical protein HRT53_06935 [Colwellia sp.]|nr:hypothetical protein [Colwellia sp.]